jgi:hypothetical protein
MAQTEAQDFGPHAHAAGVPDRRFTGIANSTCLAAFLMGLLDPFATLLKPFAVSSRAVA